MFTVPTVNPVRLLRGTPRPWNWQQSPTQCDDNPRDCDLLRNSPIRNHGTSGLKSGLSTIKISSAFGQSRGPIFQTIRTVFVSSIQRLITGTNPTYLIDADNLPALEVVRIYNPYNTLFCRLPRRQGPKSTTGDKRQIHHRPSRGGPDLRTNQTPFLRIRHQAAL